MHVTPLNAISASRAAWLDNPHRERITLLSGMLLSYQGVAATIRALPWTARYIALLDTELTALQAKDTDKADAARTQRMIHEQLLDE